VIVPPLTLKTTPQQLAVFQPKLPKERDSGTFDQGVFTEWIAHVDRTDRLVSACGSESD